jgi:hypothetical protein
MVFIEFQEKMCMQNMYVYGPDSCLAYLSDDFFVLLHCLHIKKIGIQMVHNND